MDALLSVGGPATAKLAWVPEIINYTGAGSLVPLSFVSTHSYPTDLRHMAQPNRTVYEDQIIEQAEIAHAAGLPLVLTEMSAGLNNAYDSYFAAAFIVHVASAFLGVPNVPTLSFWTFTDVFEEPGMDSVPWAETFGMQTKWGVPKPSYRAFQLLAQMPTTGVPVTVTGQPRVARRHRAGAASAATATSGTVDIITAVDDSLGTTVAVAALLTNYELNIKNTEDPTEGNPIATETVTVVFTLPPGATPSASASLQLLDSQHGCALGTAHSAQRTRPLCHISSTPTFSTDPCPSLPPSPFPTAQGPSPHGWQRAPPPTPMPPSWMLKWRPARLALPLRPSPSLAAPLPSHSPPWSPMLSSWPGLSIHCNRIAKREREKITCLPRRCPPPLRRPLKCTAAAPPGALPTLPCWGAAWGPCAGRPQ